MKFLFSESKKNLYLDYVNSYMLHQEKKCSENSGPYFDLVLKHLNMMKAMMPRNEGSESGTFERRAVKYIDLLESYRLVKYQYCKYSNLKKSYVESVYASTALEILRNTRGEVLRVADIGCGPSRITYELLDFFPNAKFELYDFSITNLFLADMLLCSGKSVEIPYRVLSKFSEKHKRADVDVMKIPGKKSDNVALFVCDLEDCLALEDSSYDIINATHSLNLMGDPDKVIKRLVKKLRVGGIFVLSDLLGWKEDRDSAQRRFPDGKAIYDFFGSLDNVKVLSYWYGGPYCEEFNSERYDYYTNHMFVITRIK